MWAMCLGMSELSELEILMREKIFGKTGYKAIDKQLNVKL